MSHGIYHLEPDVNSLSQMAVVVLPATANLVGGVKQGAGIAIAADGTISATGGGAGGSSSISVDGVLVGNVTSVPIEIDGIALP